MNTEKRNKIILNIIKKNLKLKKILNFNLAVGQIPQWDSMVHLNIFFTIKKKFKRVDINNASNVRSIKDWIELIENLYK
tara:strand:- start:212 stop:448 length:237 start_codon:yes stop_codon:yes gene_type:complete